MLIFLSLHEDAHIGSKVTTKNSKVTPVNANLEYDLFINAVIACLGPPVIAFSYMHRHMCLQIQTCQSGCICTHINSGMCLKNVHAYLCV